MKIRSQNGFTLLEILLVVAVGAVITPVLATIIYQVNRGADRINRDFVVQQDIDTASTYFYRDLSQAQSTDLTDGNPETSICVTWVDETGWATGGSEAHYAEYSLSGTQLQRNFDGTVSIAGRYVQAVQFSRTGSFITITITSSLGGRSQSLDYFVSPRADAGLQPGAVCP